jgi:hypothetical protein
LVFAMVETLLAFLVCLCVGFLISPKWDHGRRVALLSVLFLILGLCAMFSQLYFILGWSLPDGLFNFAVSSGHPVRILYLYCLMVVVPSVFLATYAVLRSEKAYQVVNDLIDRLSLLTMVYLMLDVFALIIVIVRNI